MEVCIKVTYGDVSERSCKLMFEFDVYYRNIEVINVLIRKSLYHMTSRRGAKRVHYGKIITFYNINEILK